MTDPVSGDVLRTADFLLRTTDGDRDLTVARSSQLEVASTRGVLSAKAATISIRLQFDGNLTSTVLVSRAGGAGRCGFMLKVDEVDGSRRVLLEFITDESEKPLRLWTPENIVAAGRHYQFTVTYSGARLRLFVDGVLVDEEWPMGSPLEDEEAPWVIGGVGAAGICGGVDYFAIWRRVLSDAELCAMAGGAAEVTTRENEVLGPLSRRRTLQYWRPRGHNTGVGDCMPFFHNGRYHLYYLLDRRSHRSKWGLGAHEWAHVSSADLLSWDHHPTALGITDEWEGSICTGTPFVHEGVWYAFFATRMPDRTQHLSMATSPDGVIFEKLDPNPIASPIAPYKSGPYRDPIVFADADGKFHMLVTAELETPVVEGHGGVLAHLTSTDLKKWSVQKPFFVPGYFGHQPECPDYFRWGDWYYLIFSHHGLTHYRLSRSPFGPWIRPRIDVLDAPSARVMKTAEFNGGRRIGAAFVAVTGYGGHVVFREIVQNQDGTLGTAWPEEMIPPVREPIAALFSELSIGVTVSGDTVAISAEEGFAATVLRGVPREYLFEARVIPSAGTNDFGLCVFGMGEYGQGIELRIEARRGKVGWRTPGSVSWSECENTAIYGVDGVDVPFQLRVLVTADVLDVAIGGTRTLICLSPKLDGDQLYLFCQDGTVRFEAVRVMPLV